MTIQTTKRIDAISMPQATPALLHQGYLPDDNGHAVYFSEHGNASGPASVVLHGGPGSSCNLSMLDWFDLSRQRVILLDQRGAGKSLPTGGLSQNTTADLVSDLERLRQSLQIARWSVVGGSWGSALGIVYAGSFPQVVSSLILRGVFLASQREMHWFFQSLAALVPQAWRQLTLAWTSQQKCNVLQSLTALLHNGTLAEMQDAAQRWNDYEAAIMQAMTGLPSSHRSSDLEKLTSKYRLQSHYLSQHCFLKTRAVFRHARAAGKVPTVIVHGTHDWICPPENVIHLQRFMPDAAVRWVEKGTHTTSDPAICAALREAVRDMLEYS
ncbi:MAG: alpha/beta fold hydrolase [Glaciimonas sp.]|nr:alpha/beta fold hydrolase [Glaciimonas sp.]